MRSSVLLHIELLKLSGVVFFLVRLMVESETLKRMLVEKQVHIFSIFA